MLKYKLNSIDGLELFKQILMNSILIIYQTLNLNASLNLSLNWKFIKWILVLFGQDELR